MNNLLSDGISSETIFCTTVPSRIFLCDVIKFAAQQNNSGRLFRLMGTIVEIIPQNPITDEGRRASSSTTCGDDCSPNKLLFVIDDGSGTVAVFTERKTDTAAPMLPSPSPALKVGLTVDCIGKLVIHGEERLSDGQSCCSSDKQQDKSPPVWLIASSVSIVTSPQEELLRQIELINNDSNNLRNNTNTESNSTISIGGKLADDNMPRNRILLAGDLNSKLNSIFYNSSSVINNNKQQQQLHPQQVPEIIFKPDDAFRFIRYSKDEGGISIDDLALLVGATKAKEKRAVKSAVEYLQNQGMVYLKQGKYYPL